MKKIILSLMLMLFAVTVPCLSYATVTSTTNSIQYSGDGVSSTFTFPFNIWNSASENDLIVQKVVVSTGVITTLSLSTGYTVTLTHAIPSPGSITLLAGALPSGTTLIISRSLPLTQQVSIADNSATPAATTNQVYDRNIMISQQLNQSLLRGILQSPLATSTITFPSAVSGQCIGWAGDSTLTNLACSGSSGGGGGTAFNPPIADSQLQSITSSSKVNGSAIFSLSSLPSGAGIIPVANIPVGISASSIVQLTATTKYPAVDGSLITNISGVNFTGLASIPAGAGLIPAANLPGSTAHFQVFTSSGTFTAPTGVNQVFLTIAGGGGSGGCTLAGGTGGGSGGGGAGASVINRPYTVVAGNNYTVTVGAGGTPVTIGVDGAASVFDVLSINGGAHGIDGTAVGAEGNGGVGGANAATPLPLFSTGATTATTGSTAPSSLIPGGNGSKGTSDTVSGAGGSTPFGVGAAGQTSGALAGNAATANTGAGGGGATGADGSLHLGGNGGSGIVIVQY